MADFGSSAAGKKGGKARANSLTAEERSDIARKAAATRWGNRKDDGRPRAICGGETPLRIGDVEIPCYVLNDERRVITASGMQGALGMSTSGGSPRLASFASQIADNKSMAQDLSVRLESPIEFVPPHGGLAKGYEATLLADLCDGILESRKRGRLTDRYKRFAEYAEILVRGFAVVGIIALVDEATGYQQYRSRQALSEILEKYISDKMLVWAKRFPDEFYTELFRLKGWKYTGLKPGANKPGIVGKYTRQIVYQRLAPGVIHELERLNPTVNPGQRKNKHHQWLSEDVGHPELREHLAIVTTIMKLSDGWRDFQTKLRRVLPKKWDQQEFADLFPEWD